MTVLRILILVHGYPPTFLGGAEQRAERTALALSKLGHDVRVMCVESINEPQAGGRWEDGIQDQITIRRVYFRYGDTPHPFRESYDNPYTAQALENLLTMYKPDIVHLFGGYLISASVVHVARQHNLPVIISLTDYWWICHRINLLRTDGKRCNGPTLADCARCHAESRRRFRIPARLWPYGADRLWEVVEQSPSLCATLGFDEQEHRRTMLLDILKDVQILIAPSHYLAHFHVSQGVDPSRITVSRQGVNLDHCLLRPRAQQLRIAYLGQVKPHKGIHLLIEAWGHLTGHHPRHLSIYGQRDENDPYVRRLRLQTERMNTVSWEESFHSSQVWKVLANLDAIVVPSRWVENSPNIILEAQAVGVPVIGSNLGGIAELVKHEYNGLLFAPDSVTDLTRQLQRLLDDPRFLQRLRRAENPFQSVQQSIKRLEGLYLEALQRV